MSKRGDQERQGGPLNPGKFFFPEPWAQKEKWREVFSLEAKSPKFGKGPLFKGAL